MPDAIERLLASVLAAGSCEMGEVLIEETDAHYLLRHREDTGRNGLRVFLSADDAMALARFDDAGKYRALKTAPNLGHGWELRLATFEEVRRAIDYFYPGRLAAWTAFAANRLVTTSLRETLNRQSGMYRAAARISDKRSSEVVASVCRSDKGCLRTILWARDESGERPTRDLPSEKFDASHAGMPTGAVIPLLCQEPCNLLVAACREAVRKESA